MAAFAPHGKRLPDHGAEPRERGAEGQGESFPAAPLSHPQPAGPPSVAFFKSQFSWVL